MKRFYFTFMQRDLVYRNCYHVEEAETRLEAREKMTQRLGRSWAFQYDESEWRVSENQYHKLYDYDPTLPAWFDGMTQADVFRLKEV